MKVISSTVNSFIVCVTKYGIYNVQSQLQWSDVYCVESYMLSYAYCLLAKSTGEPVKCSYVWTISLVNN